MGGGDAQSVAPGGSRGDGGDPQRPVADMAMVLRDPSALYFLMHQVQPWLVSPGVHSIAAQTGS